VALESSEPYAADGDKACSRKLGAITFGADIANGSVQQSIARSPLRRGRDSTDRRQRELGSQFSTGYGGQFVPCSARSVYGATRSTPVTIVDAPIDRLVVAEARNGDTAQFDSCIV
jgi:hypothetical protein